MRNYPNWGPPKRNDNWKLTPVNDHARYDDAVHTGAVAEDGFEVMAKSNPNRAGDPPTVRGTEYSIRRGQDRSFES